MNARTETVVHETDVADSELRRAFEAFFDAHRVALFRRLCLITGTRSDAEEVAQDAFVRLWERWDRVAGLEDPEGYLYRTAMNLVRRRYSRAGIQLRKLVGSVPDEDPFTDSERRTEVTIALARLTPRQRAALVLTTMLGWTSEEAGRILHIRASTVRALANQGREALRRSMEDPR